MAFQLDTSGVVLWMEEFAPGCDQLRSYEWDDLSPFAQGYVEALHQGSAWLDWERHPGHNEPQPWGFSDLALETLARIMEDCAEAIANPINGYRGAAKIDGTWFYAMRAKGNYPEFPPLTPYLGDDGKVYLREAGE